MKTVISLLQKCNIKEAENKYFLTEGLKLLHNLQSKQINRGISDAELFMTFVKVSQGEISR